MGKDILKKNNYERIINDIEYPYRTSSYCSMIRDYASKYGVIDDKEFIEALFLYRGYIPSVISEDIKKDKDFFIKLFELASTSKEIINIRKCHNELFVGGVTGKVNEFLDESLRKDDDVLAALLMAEPKLVGNPDYISFTKESIKKALARNREINPLSWYEINSEICDNIMDIDKYKDDEEFVFEILKYNPREIRKFDKDVDFVKRALEYSPQIYTYLPDKLKNDQNLVELLIRYEPTYDLDNIPAEVRKTVVNKLKDEIRERLLKEKNYESAGFFGKMSIKREINNELKYNYWARFLRKNSSKKSDLSYLGEGELPVGFSYEKIFEDYVLEDLSLSTLVLGVNDLSEEEALKQIKNKFKEVIKKNKEIFIEEFSDVTLQRNFYNYIHNYSDPDNIEEQEAIIKNSLNNSVKNISNFIARYAIDIDKSVIIGKTNDEYSDELLDVDKEKIKNILRNPIYLGFYIDSFDELENIKISDVLDNSAELISEMSNMIKDKCIKILQEMKSNQSKKSTTKTSSEEPKEEEKKTIKHKK